MKRFAYLLIPGAMLMAGASAQADVSEAQFLQPYAGKFAGTGMVTDNVGGSTRNLTCDFTGVVQGASMMFNGTCQTALIVNITISIAIQADAKGRYTGSYRDSSGNTATLSGSRRNATLALTFRDTDSPHPPAAMTIMGSGASVSVSLQRKPGDKARNVRLSLRKA